MLSDILFIQGLHGGLIENGGRVDDTGLDHTVSESLS